MIHNSEPSQRFLDTIQAAYEQEALVREVTPAGIWNYVVAVCLQRRKGFDEMFTWDTRSKPSQKRNRIADIAEPSNRDIYQGCGWR